MTGFHGRRGIFEFMRLNEEIRALVLERASAGGIREAARRYGLRSLSEDGWRIVGEGATTVEEVLRVSRDERQSDSDAAP
jgi:type II secretory ATPase GspE/PulE/Tfp pilus assembly ATPase PilB-like protein